MAQKIDHPDHAVANPYGKTKGAMQVDPRRLLAPQKRRIFHNIFNPHRLAGLPDDAGNPVAHLILHGLADFPKSRIVARAMTMTRMPDHCLAFIFIAPGFAKIPVELFANQTQKMLDHLPIRFALTNNSRNRLMQSQPELNPPLFGNILSKSQNPADGPVAFPQQMVAPQDPQPAAVTGQHVHIADLRQPVQFSRQQRRESLVHP